ncbi:MAG: diphosphomevalonate decarboxylase [Pseudomonadales bacterium]
MLTKAEVIARYLPATLSTRESACVFAPSNIALCKYWGKREVELNLPTNASLSVSLAHLGTTTEIRHSDTGEDSVLLNNQAQSLDSDFARKVIAFVDLFRRAQHLPLIIDTRNNIPTAAGLASSASGFAALTLGLNQFFALELPLPVLSAFARMGSGSASRSVYTGFVRWDMGLQDDGMDSIAKPLEMQWSTLRIGLIKVSSAAKAVGSRTGMQRTIQSSTLYANWPAQAAADIETLEHAIAAQDFAALGACAEQNAMTMHATMMAAWPPLVYWQPDSLSAMQKVWQLREAGVAVYFTMDAGPNLKLLFNEESEALIRAEFPEVEIVSPFIC